MKVLDLFKPKWKHSNQEIRKNAIKKLTKQSSLISIALKDDDVCSVLAVDKITEVSTLKEIIQTAQSVESRKAAVDKITDESYLIKIVETATKLTVEAEPARRAIERIIDLQKSKDGKEDQQLLKRMAISTHRNPTVQFKILKYISDQNILAEICRYPRLWGRKQSLERIYDQSILGELAKEELDKCRPDLTGCLSEYLDKIDDISTLKELSSDRKAQIPKVRNLFEGAIRRVQTWSDVFSKLRKIEKSDSFQIKEHYVEFYKDSIEPFKESKMVNKYSDENSLVDYIKSTHGVPDQVSHLDKPFPHLELQYSGRSHGADTVLFFRIFPIEGNQYYVYFYGTYEWD